MWLFGVGNGFLFATFDCDSAGLAERRNRWMLSPRGHIFASFPPRPTPPTPPAKLKWSLTSRSWSIILCFLSGTLCSAVEVTGDNVSFFHVYSSRFPFSFYSKFIAQLVSNERLRWEVFYFEYKCDTITADLSHGPRQN